jgi:hypothetical protein
MSASAVSSESRTNPVIQWLLEGDPSIRWQVLRDLLGDGESAVDRERRKITHDGWGARLLARQNAAGTWACGRSSDGLYSPKWISTTYTMLLLRDFGLPPNAFAARKACKLLLDGGLQPDGGVSYGTWAKWTGRGETCITGMILSILSYFHYADSRLDTSPITCSSSKCPTAAGIAAATRCHPFLRPHHHQRA